MAATQPLETATNSGGLPAEFERLRHLIPLRRLGDAEFARVMRSAALEHLKPGAILFRAGIDDRSIFYLLDGTIEIEGEGGDRFSLIGGSIETAHPLSPHARARRLAVATTPITFVRLPIELLQIEPQEQSPRAGFEVEEIEEDIAAADKRIVFDVYHALMDGSFALPTLPDIAIRIRAAAADADKGVDEITRVAQSDPAIAAYCIRMANNAAYAGASRVTGIRDAVVRMGADATADMITAYTLRELFTAPDAGSRAFMQLAWRHSARIAALSFVIAKHTQKINPEQALLGGLLHDIGMLIIISEWHKQAQSALTETSLRALGRELNGSLGSMVLRNWRLGDSIVLPTLESEHFSRQSGAALDICDCIALAHAHDDTPPPWSVEPPPVEQIAPYAKLPDGSLSEDQRLQLVIMAEAELNQLDTMLKS